MCPAANALQTPWSDEKDVEEVLQAQEKKFLCSLWRSHTESRWICPKKKCSPWKGAGFLARTAVHDPILDTGKSLRREE